ncbi:PTS system trehalose-specific EIIBC component (Includes: Trehalose-specific phosphotransferase enzyme IIB component; Trehalose permease IIC component) [Vibrio nigripulchritudo SFn27]|uniref:PTS system trehalose-specific EIIBC component n=1 Tax=Vibrio nigripulchritudo TaxID=28173 RepID=U4K0M7_9VIBR|nr:PTS trehalose transporter subunit IIBC [Vibrio nigripulchritudo]CCN82311.1 PTS system trehalose-specific EIIBC component (Includes: Trehalose-specific phosphotransferase enzyme IIB component; Trehalose permease IIC component) [Vibrio nigripulchritudo BLFn1]CCN88473.1 PTS system trehalose-specific EIIBC component (Includes: Trehalose-specific phosphotransferase enzyme IIB component; Trehalose permease IIC component) [Vibrio nigripulchritudo SFn27]CCN95880.1 PTS system trehalose-specific EIIBC 
MSKVAKQDVAKILELVGGSDNIASVSHCLTRLRFVLNDTEAADVKGLESISIVRGCFTNAGQFQVVIGNEVDEVYKILLELSGKSSASKDEAKLAARQNMNILERGISHLAEIFVPLLPAIITGGLILGFRNVIGDIKMFDGQTLTQISQFWATVHSFLWLIGEAIFFFLPVGVCWSTVRKLGGTPILGITLGVTLVSPQLMNAYLIGKEVPEVWDFGLFVIEKVGYQAQVIPAMLAGMALAFIETNLKRIVPGYLYLVVVPFVSILLSVILAHSLIGPFGRMLGDGVAFAAKAAMTGDFAIVGATIFGFLYAPLVITGVHHTTNAVDLQLMQELGGTPIWPLIALSNIAQASAVVGIILISRKEGERDISVPAAISAYLGVTEPAMYGINLKYKFPMLSAMAGSAIAAAICGSAGVMANGIGVGGLPGILSIQPQYWTIFGVAMLVAIFVPAMLTLFFYKRAQQKGELLAAAA